MNIRRLNALLILWCVVLLAPGIVVALGAFGRMDAHTTIPGSLVLLWLVGYLAQFAIFMWIMNIVGKQRILWWILASLLPWAIDWTLPVSPLFLLAWVPIAIGLASWISLVARRSESLQEHGIQATGTVLEVLKPWMNVVINNVYIKRKVRLRIEREDGTPAYEGILNGLFMLGEIPSPGDRIPILVDPANSQRFEYDKGRNSARPVPLHRETPHAGGDQGGIVNELERLTRLHDRGAITDSEFNAAKKKLLS